MINIYAYTLALLPLVFILWVASNPLEALKTILYIKHRFREHLIEKYGTEIVEDMFADLRTFAKKKNINKALVEQVINERKDELIRKHGKKYVDKYIGKPGDAYKFFYGD